MRLKYTQFLEETRPVNLTSKWFQIRNILSLYIPHNIFLPDNATLLLLVDGTGVPVDENTNGTFSFNGSSVNINSNVQLVIDMPSGIYTAVKYCESDALTDCLLNSAVQVVFISPSFHIDSLRGKSNAQTEA